MSDAKLDAVLKMQTELSGQLYGLTIAVAHLFSIEALEVAGGAADRALGDVDGTVAGLARQLPAGPKDVREAVIAQLRRCLEIASAQVERVKRQAPTSTNPQ